MPAPFRCKICGIQSPQEAEMAVLCGADALGFNFHAGSRRFVSANVVSDIVALRLPVQHVGLFVEQTVEEINQIVTATGVTLIQLHGDYSPQDAAACGAPVMRAFRLKTPGLEEARDYAKTCAGLGVPLAAVLLDAHVDGQFGGTGKSLPWLELQQQIAGFEECPVILAGGLNPTNVEEAILAARPAGVDVASGVEFSAGGKDPARVRAFCENALAALKLVRATSE